MPVFDTIESALVGSYRFKPSRTLRLIARSSYVGKYILTEMESVFV